MAKVPTPIRPPPIPTPDLARILKPFFPQIAKGVITAPRAGVWVSVRYTDPITNAVVTFAEPPTVVAVAELRTGRIPSVTAPRISIPSITLPKAPTIRLTSIRIPRITTTERYLRRRIRDRCGDWGLLNWFRDRFSEVVAKVLKFVWDILIQPQIDRVRNTINSGLRTQKTRVQDSVNRGLSDTRSKTQDALNDYRGRIQSAINSGLSDVIPTLYAMVGLPDGQLISPTNIRNVRKNSFEFYALTRGMKLHYVAIGKMAPPTIPPRLPALPGPPRLR